MKKISLLVLFVLIFVFVGCKKSDTTEPTNSICATQIETSSRCNGVLTPCDGEQLKNSVQCLGKTTSNVRCNNKTKNACGYCHLHTAQWNSRCPIETRNACGYCNDHKDQYTEE